MSGSKRKPYKRLNLTPNSKKVRRGDQKKKYDASRINVGEAIEQWSELRTQESCTDEELANTLLASWKDNRCLDSPARLHSTPCTRHAPKIEAAYSPVMASDIQFQNDDLGTLQYDTDSDDFNSDSETKCNDTTANTSLWREEQIKDMDSSRVGIDLSILDECEYDESWEPDATDIDLYLEESGSRKHAGSITAQKSWEEVIFDSGCSTENFEEEEEIEEEKTFNKFCANPDRHKCHKVETPGQLLGQKACLAYEDPLLELAHMNIPVMCTCGEPISHVVSKSGTCMSILWVCTNGHKVYQWWSQQLFKRQRVGNFALSSGITITGNSYAKTKFLLDKLGIGCVSESTHYRIQALYVHPAVQCKWKEVQREVITRVKDRMATDESTSPDLDNKAELIVAGDGRNDSPGHSAQYCVYTFIEHNSGDILAQQVVDKREVEHKSPNMERAAFVRCLAELERLQVTPTEIVTDAHPQIPPIMRQDHPDKKHSWDTWHGAKNFASKLCQAAVKKENRDLLPWIQHLSNHFWFASQNADSNWERFHKIPFGSIHHITGEHMWAGGQCPHVEIGIDEDGHIGPINNSHIIPEDPDRPYLKPGSKGVQALETILTETRFVRTLGHYTRFRHSGILESYHNLVLLYAPKRQSYSFEAFKCRHQLASLDHQAHKDRAQASTKDNKPRFHKTYSKRTNTWSAEPIKEAKMYNYIPQLFAQIMQERISDTGLMQRRREVGLENPKRIAGNVAKVPAPPKEELVQKRQELSRFK